MSSKKLLLPIMISSLLLGVSEGQLQGLAKTIQGRRDKVISVVSSPVVAAGSAVAAPVKTISGAIAKPVMSAGKAVAAPVEDTVAAVSTPVEKTIIKTILTNCNAYKKVLGVTYEQIDNKNPDISKLTLDIWNGQQKDTFNISDDGISKYLRSKNYNSRPITIFIHGFQTSSQGDAAVEMATALTKKFADKRTILTLDSSSFIEYYYLRSSTYTRFLGQKLGAKLADFHKDGVAPNDIHLIGHSFGSYIAGFAGKSFNEITSKKVGRISGLDPAGPCFFQKPQELRLGKEDADFVDVIHTSAGVFGIANPIGHIDFYPNGGSKQPGCLIPPCSHSRSWGLYRESVNAPENFIGVKCASWNSYKSGSCSSETALMGFGTDPSARGVFYLSTKRSPPYGKGATILTTTPMSFIKRLIS